MNISGSWHDVVGHLTVSHPPVFPDYVFEKREANRLRQATQAVWDRQDALEVLWAGQPEAGDCAETLRRITPSIVSLGATVLLKAHPRDQSYATGIYTTLLRDSGIHCKDITQLDVAQSLALAPMLIITQFSSVAVEAGFYGIPALHLIYDDVGGARLLRRKGYAVPPYCLGGAGFFLQHHGTEQAEKVGDERTGKVIVPNIAE